jgi:hypothetical protein
VTLEFSLLSGRNPFSGALISEISGSLKITLGVKTTKHKNADYTEFIDNEVFSDNWVLLGEGEGEAMVVTFEDTEPLLVEDGQGSLGGSTVESAEHQEDTEKGKDKDESW